MSVPSRIVIAENHTILKEGLLAILEPYEDYEVVGVAADGFEAIKCVEKYLPDLVLMDLSMPKMNGLEATEEIKRRWANTRVLVLTVHNDEEYLVAALKAKVDGYLIKDASRDELMVAIKSVLEGKTYLSPGISNRVIEGYLEGRQATKSSLDTLTKREREILKLIAEGYKNREIAECCCISVKTVEKHRSNLMKKLDLHNAAALTSFAVKNGMITV